MNAPRRLSTRRGGARGPRGLAALAALLAATTLASTPFAPAIRTVGSADAAPVPTPVTLYDNVSPAGTKYFADQGGHEALDDLHLTAGGTLDTLTFEYYEPVAGAPFSATVSIYRNPRAGASVDIAATTLLGRYSVTGLTDGRRRVTVPLTDAPAVDPDLWVGIAFSSTTAGLIYNNVPAVGSSHNLYMENGNLYVFDGGDQANFAIRLVDSPTFRLGVAIAGSGSVTLDPDRTAYVSGTTVRITPVPAPHWHFRGWSNDATGTDQPLSVVVDRDLTITANFGIDTYLLSYAAGPHGTLTGPTSQTVAHGADAATVTAVPDPGYRFVRWSDGVLTAARTDRSVAGPLSVTAFFDVIDLACNGGFETDLAGWTRTGSGELLRVAPGRASGWALRLRSGSSSDVGLDDSPNCIRGAFAGDRYRFSVWARAGSPASVGRNLKLRVYEYDGSSQVGSYVSAQMKLTTGWTRLVLEYVVRRTGTSLSERILYDPDESGEHVFIDDVMIEPIDHPLRFTITAGAGSGGSITPSGAVVVNQGDTRSFTIAPSPGFQIADVVVDGTSEGAIASRTFTGVQRNHTIQASFAAIPPGQNLVADPSFESGIGGWTRYGSATLSWSGDARTGARSLQVANGGSGSFGCDDSPNWVARVTGVGTPYRFRAWVKAGPSSNLGKVKIRVYEFEGSSQVGSTVYSEEIPLTSSWQQLTALHTVRRANTTLSMRVTGASSRDVFLVDDVAVEELPTALRAQRSLPEGDAAIELERPIVVPNPSRGDAVLALALARPGALRVEIVDLAGRRVRLLADRRDAAAGTHRFALAGERGARLPAGIYFYRAEVDGVAHRGRFVILE